MPGSSQGEGKTAPKNWACKRPQACFQPFFGLRPLSLSLSLDKAFRASLSKGLLQLLTLHEKRGILTINFSSVSQILPQNWCFPNTCPTGATIPKTRHVAGETANFLLKWTPTQLGENPSTNPCTTQHQSQPCPSQGQN